MVSAGGTNAFGNKVTLTDNAIGGVSLLWLVPWCFVVPRLPAGAVKEASGWAPTYRELISKRALWGTVLGKNQGASSTVGVWE